MVVTVTHERWLTSNEVAELAGCGPRTVRNYRQVLEEYGLVQKIYTTQYLYSPDVVEFFKTRVKVSGRPLISRKETFENWRQSQDPS